MNGLKDALHPIAGALGWQASALYERQRQLVRAGVLEQTSGRGPGSGVRVTPHNVAVIIISAACGGSIAENAKLTRKLMAAKSDSHPRHALIEAIATILATPVGARLTMCALEGWAWIETDGGEAEFACEDRTSATGIRVMTIIPSATLVRIAEITATGERAAA